MKKVILISIASIVVLFGVTIVRNNLSPQTLPVVTVNPTTKMVKTVSYDGQTGRDALSILKEKANVEQNSSGLVIAINDWDANDKKREYWAFYVNGEMATVGPADYVTKDTDKIEWKIENY